MEAAGKRSLADVNAVRIAMGKGEKIMLCFGCGA